MKHFGNTVKFMGLWRDFADLLTGAGFLPQYLKGPWWLWDLATIWSQRKGRVILTSIPFKSFIVYVPNISEAKHEILVTASYMSLSIKWLILHIRLILVTVVYQWLKGKLSKPTSHWIDDHQSHPIKVHQGPSRQTFRAICSTWRGYALPATPGQERSQLGGKGTLITKLYMYVIGCVHIYIYIYIYIFICATVKTPYMW